MPVAQSESHPETESNHEGGSRGGEVRKSCMHPGCVRVIKINPVLQLRFRLERTKHTKGQRRRTRVQRGSLEGKGKGIPHLMTAKGPCQRAHGEGTLRVRFERLTHRFVRQDIGFDMSLRPEAIVIFVFEAVVGGHVANYLRLERGTKQRRTSGLCHLMGIREERSGRSRENRETKESLLPWEDAGLRPANTEWDIRTAPP